MLKALPILAVAALAMAWAIPVCAIAETHSAARALQAAGVQLAENSAAASTTGSASATRHTYHHRYRHHRYRHHYRSRHHYTYRRHHYRHHARTASEDPKPSEPKAEPTRGVIPKISP